MPTSRILVLIVAASVAIAGLVAFTSTVSASAQTLTLAPTADSFVAADKPTTNFGSAGRWSVDGRSDRERVALLRFTINLPVGQRITSVTLRARTGSSTSSTDVVDVYAGSSGWAESDVTWRTAPARNALLARSGGSGDRAWVEWDLTRSAPTNGQLDLQLATDGHGWVWFASRESRTQANRPQLVVQTTPLTPSPTSTASPTASPTRSPTPTPAPTTPPSGSGDVVVAAVGDMNPPGNTSTTSAAGRNASAIIGGLANGSVDNFLALGDFQYEKGTCTDLVAYWNRLFGAAVPDTYWTAGPNHDVEPGVNDDLDRFMNGQCAGSTAVSATSRSEGGFVDALQFYSFDIGRWHVAVLPTPLWRYDAPRAQQMTTQIDADLAAARAAGRHLAAIYHDPYFTSDTSSHTRFSEAKPWIDVLWKHRVRLTLSGSQHNYERSCPINNADQCVVDGMTAFQVSTGGIGLRTFTSSPGYIVKRFSDTWGHLVLTLKADGGFSWQFRAVAGGMQTDSGTALAG